VIHGEMPSAEEVADAVRRCLTDSPVRDAARHQRARLLEQPSADDVAAFLTTRFG
jgi:UDP:flavonoid glycosyltransferase YjiC (YdhE family)